MFALISVWMCYVMCGCMERRQDKKEGVELKHNRKKVAMLFVVQNSKFKMRFCREKTENTDLSAVDDILQPYSHAVQVRLQVPKQSSEDLDYF